MVRMNYLHASYRKSMFISISTLTSPLFTKTLRLSQIPAEWKLANSIPLHKKGDRENVQNYHPSSLLSIISKILERCVLNDLSYHIHSNINWAQYGFVNGKSSTAQLSSMLNTIGKNLDEGLQTDVVLWILRRHSIKWTTLSSYTNFRNLVSLVLSSCSLKIIYLNYFFFMYGRIKATQFIFRGKTLV